MPVCRDLPDRSENRRGVTKMPTTYAHDLFGKRVYRKLSAKLQHLIRSNGNLYRIGQHGPDILFYYFISKNPVTQYGVQMHGRKAREFFEKGMAKVREEKNPALMAYLLGFGCHYILDSTCHPYVNQVAAEGKVSHTLFDMKPAKIHCVFIRLMGSVPVFSVHGRSTRYCRRSVPGTFICH